jgi:hypothetical protein
VGLYQLVGKDTVIIDEVSFPTQPDHHRLPEYQTLLALF